MPDMATAPSVSRAFSSRSSVEFVASQQIVRTRSFHFDSRKASEDVTTETGVSQTKSPGRVLLEQLENQQPVTTQPVASVASAGSRSSSTHSVTGEARARSQSRLSLEQFKIQQLVSKSSVPSSVSSARSRSSSTRSVTREATAGSPRRSSLEQLENQQVVKNHSLASEATVSVVPMRSQTRPSLTRLESLKMVTTHPDESCGSMTSMTGEESVRIAKKSLTKVDSMKLVKRGIGCFHTDESVEKVAIWAESQGSPVRILGEKLARTSTSPSCQLQSSKSIAGDDFSPTPSTLSSVASTPVSCLASKRSRSRHLRRFQTVSWQDQLNGDNLPHSVGAVGADRARMLALQSSDEAEGRPHRQSNFNNGQKTEGDKLWWDQAERPAGIPSANFRRPAQEEGWSFHDERQILGGLISESASSLMWCCCRGNRCPGRIHRG